MVRVKHRMRVINQSSVTLSTIFLISLFFVSNAIALPIVQVEEVLWVAPVEDKLYRSLCYGDSTDPNIMQKNQCGGRPYLADYTKTLGQYLSVWVGRQQFPESNLTQLSLAKMLQSALSRNNQNISVSAKINPLFERSNADYLVRAWITEVSTDVLGGSVKGGFTILGEFTGDSVSSVNMARVDVALINQRSNEYVFIEPFAAGYTYEASKRDFLGVTGYQWESKLYRVQDAIKLSFDKAAIKISEIF